MTVKRMYSIGQGILKLCVTLLMICPFYLAFCYSFKSKEEIAKTGLGFPKTFYLENFKVAMERTNFIRPLALTLILTLVGTFILIIICSMGAYVISRRKSKIYTCFYLLVTLTILVPFHAYMLPLYLMLNKWGLINTLTGFTLAKVGSQAGFSIIIIMGFVKSIPFDIEEAACIDGCGVFRRFYLVVLPLMKPILLTSVIINALDIWNEYAMGVVVLRKPEMFTLPLLQQTFFGQYHIDLGQAFAIFSISMLPILIIYLFLQKYIISGIVMGGVKG